MTSAKKVASATLLLLLASSSCGYSYGTGLAKQGIRTVAFQVVGSTSYRQRLEVEISRFLARERTIVIGVPDRNRPTPTTLAEVFDYPRANEGALEGFVTMRLVARDGTVHLERRLLDRTEFRAPIGENLMTAKAELAEDLARKIALALESDF